MPGSLFISGATTIAGNRVMKNNAVIFEDKGADASGFLAGVYSFLGIRYPKFYKMDHLSKLGFLASEILLSENPLAEKYAPEDIGVILFNANSSLDTDIKYFRTVSDMASPSLFVYTLPNIVIGEICIRNKIKGENHLFISQEFDPDMVCSCVKNLFETQAVQACICGWIDWLDTDYAALMMLVEAGDDTGRMAFTKENCIELYTQING